MRKVDNIFIFIILLPFLLSFIAPIFLIGGRYQIFEIGDAFINIEASSLFRVLPYILIAFISFLLAFYKRDKITVREENNKHIDISLIFTLIFFSALSILRHIDFLIQLPSYVIQFLIPLSFLPIISLALIKYKHNKYKYIFFGIIFLDFALNLLIYSFTRDIITKLLILILVVNFKKVKIKNIFLILSIFYFLFISKDLLRNQLVKIDSVSLSDYLIPLNLAKKYNQEININNRYISNQFIINNTKEINFYENYKNYFERLDIKVDYFLDELYLENHLDNLSLCNVRDKGCLTFREFYKRIIDLSLRKPHPDNNQKFHILDPFDRFNKISNLIYYDHFINSEDNHLLKGKLYYPQIYSILPIPRFIWKDKPTNNNGHIIGEYFKFNTYKSGYNAWYEPLIIELLISFGFLGIIIFTIINFITISYLAKIKDLINYDFNKATLFVGLMKFYFDYQIQGLIESLGGFIYLITVIFFGKFFIRVISKFTWLRG